nr:MAG TPA: hypothetical protein [Caudoviricetes sp.]
MTFCIPPFFLNNSTYRKHASRKQVIVFQAIPLFTRWTTDIPHR